MSPCFRLTTSSLALAAALCVCLLDPRPARAQATDAFQQHLDQGLSLFKDKHYREAIEEFQDAYVLNPVPNLLFDIGQAHLKLLHCQEALSYYDRYEKAETALSQADRDLLGQSRDKARELCRVQAAPPPPAPQLLIVAPPPKRPVPLYKRWWLWTAVGVVTAGVVAGVVAGTYPRGPDYPNLRYPMYTK